MHCLEMLLPYRFKNFNIKSFQLRYPLEQFRKLWDTISEKGLYFLVFRRMLNPYTSHISLEHYSN